MAVDNDMIVFFGSSEIGQGEPDLGAKLMDSFLKMLLESGKVPAKIFCMNSAIYLTTEGSAVIDHLRKFEKEGTEILSCTTCLNYFQRMEKLQIGRPTDMKETVDAMLKYNKVLSPC